MDFELHFNLDRDIRILEITDFQPVDWSQQRYVGRLNGEFDHEFGDEDRYNGCYRYVDELVAKVKPDLILMLGDNVYGEFDDNGSNLKKMIEKMESYGIPWAPIFGNHDNECKLGVAWQCKQFENASNCLFKRNSVSGNGNYSIGIFNNGSLVRMIFMMDSNGCWNGKTYSYLENYPPYNQDEKMMHDANIYPDQLEWIKKESEGHDVPKTICMHIPCTILNKQCIKNGYYKDEKEKFILGKDVKPLNGDFGQKMEWAGSFECPELKDVLQNCLFDTMFVGHCHTNSISVLCDDFLRITFVVKTGTFDYHDDSLLGGTLFSVSTRNGDYKIEHQLVK